MKLIYLVSCVYALNDYYPSVEKLIQEGKVDFLEDYGSNPIKDVDTKSCPIPVASIAIHGGIIEKHSDEIAKKFHKVLPSIVLRNSAYYTFSSNFNEELSLKIKTKNCLKRVCCQKIGNDVIKENTEKKCKAATNGDEFRSICETGKLCQKSAAHITSTEFTTPNLTAVVKNRFVVSWHGFGERKDANNKLIHVIIGGKFKNGLEVAKEFTERTNYKYLTVFCKGAKQCETVEKPPTKSTKADVEGLEGAAKENVVNTGRCGAGLHIELSNKFRTEYTDQHQKLINAIKKHLPQSNSDITGSNGQC